MVPQWIEGAKRQLDLAAKSSRGGDLLCKRLAVHIPFTLILFYFARTTLTRIAVGVSAMLFEFALSQWQRNRAWRSGRCMVMYGSFFALQILTFLVVDSITTPEPIRIPGVIPPARGFPSATSGDPRVLVGPQGAVPYVNDLDVGSVESLAVMSAVQKGRPYVTGDDFSVVIPVRDEQQYIARTIKYTLENTPSEFIREIIVVDDMSEIPVEEVLNKELPPNMRKKVRVIRFEKKEGLIRARITGADHATAANIFFLDGHCRPKKGWIQPLLQHLKANYRRIACPVIQDIRKDTWEDVGTSGFKMMFEWNFEFGWYDDLTDEVPISAGGILAMTRRWWEESGKYDPGMLEWGGENLEQSMRVWMCGGEIFVVRNSFVGHIFDRPAKPNPGNRLVIQVQKNQKRGAKVWLDDYYVYFETYHPVVKALDEGPGLEERAALRQQLKCKPFQWYVDKFRTSFERKGLLIADFKAIQHLPSRWCLTARQNDQTGKRGSGAETRVVLEPCVAGRHDQEWQDVAGGRMLYHRSSGKCLDRGNQRFLDNTKRPMLFDCDWNNMLRAQNENQLWHVEHSTNRVFSLSDPSSATLTGNDKYLVSPNKSVAMSSWCLSSDLLSHEAFGAYPNNMEAFYVVMRACQPATAVWDDRQSWRWLPAGDL